MPSKSLQGAKCFLNWELYELHFRIKVAALTLAAHQEKHQDKAEGEVGVQPPLEQTGWGEHCSRISYSNKDVVKSTAKFSCFKQDLAAAFGHFGLAASGSSLILFAGSHALFALYFLFPLVWNQGRSNEPALLCCQGDPCLIPAFSWCGNHQEGFQHSLSCSCPSFSAAEAALSCSVSI